MRGSSRLFLHHQADTNTDASPTGYQKAPRYSVIKNDSLGFVKVNKTTVQVFLFPLKNKFF